MVAAAGADAYARMLMAVGVPEPTAAALAGCPTVISSHTPKLGRGLGVIAAGFYLSSSA